MINNQEQIIVKLGHCNYDDGWDGDSHIIIQSLFDNDSFINVPEDALVIDATRFKSDYNLNNKIERDNKLELIRNCYLKASKIEMLNNDPYAIVRYVQEELELLTINSIKRRILK